MNKIYSTKEACEIVLGGILVMSPITKGYALNLIAELSNRKNDENFQKEVEEFIQTEIEKTEKILLPLFDSQLKSKMNIVEIAKSIAEEAHKDQYRNDKKTPYMSHIEGVVEILRNTQKFIEEINEYSLIYDEVFAVAYLHDTLEDTTVTEEMLRGKMPFKVVEAVKILTRKENQSYDDYLVNVSVHRLARIVKIADMLHNLTDSPSKNQKARYMKGIMYLSM